MRYGATDSEWALFSMTLGIAEDLLPTVCNPNAKISPNSKLTKTGKIPSLYNGHDLATGMKDWTSHRTTDDEIEKWSGEEDYGICISTRNVRAIDLDISDPNAIAQITHFIHAKLRPLLLPVRLRSNSSRRILAFRMAGSLPKRTLQVSDGMVEILGTGNHFVACGQHESGVRYEWDWQGQADFPELTQEQFERLWSGLVDKFGVELPSNSSQRRNAPSFVVNDETVDKLTAIGRGKDGEVYITCPWKDQHTCESGVTETAYFPRGSRGYEMGHFRCLHAHCAGRTDMEFEEALGIRQDVFEAIPDEPDAKMFPRLRKTKDGQIKSILENLNLAMPLAHVCGYYIAKDSFKEAVLLRSSADKMWEQLTDVHYTKIQEHLEKVVRFKSTIPFQLLTRSIDMTAEILAFDSAKIWLTKQNWDGKKRIGNFLNEYAKTESSAYSRAVSQYMWTAMAGRVMSPGIKADMVPIFVGAQGTYKSTSIKAMSPQEDWSGIISLEDKAENLARIMKGKVILEISEFRGLHNNKEVETIKTFIASTHDEWVPKYRENTITYARRSLFIGTTNIREILADKTGHRRWLPIDTGIIDIERIRKDKEKLWAEGREAFLAEGIAYATAEELAKDKYEKYTIQDSWELYIQKWLYEKNDFTGKTPIEQEFFIMNDLLEGALKVDSRNLRGHEDHRAARLLRGMGFDRRKKWVSGRSQWVWFKLK